MHIHDVSHPAPPFRSASGALEVHQVPSWKDNFIWILICTATGAAAAIDGPEHGPALLYCDRLGIRLTALFNTHTHWDHIGINKSLAAAGKLGDLRVVGPAGAAAEVPGLTEPVDDGDRVTLGHATGRVLRTEGHLNGHISYVFDDLLFCGDTLFGAGCGYLFDGPPETMHESLERLAALPEETRVCCAHEYTLDNLRFAWTIEPDNPELADRIRSARSIRERGGSTVPSTIGLERATNPFLRHHAPTLRARVAEALPDLPMESPAQFFKATRLLKDSGDYKTMPDDAWPT